MDEVVGVSYQLSALEVYMEMGLRTQNGTVLPGLPRSHALRGNAYRKALPSICESQLPYDPYACMVPKTEAEPLRTHSQAEPGNERFSKLSRLMSMAENEHRTSNVQ